jgi:hypothetical protein
MPFRGLNPENRDSKKLFKIKYLRYSRGRENGALKQGRKNTAL